MNILAFDTSTEAFSVALKVDEKVHHHFELAPRLHAQKILPTIDQLLKTANIAVADIDAFVFGRGPGAFTGVRTAVGVVQGLAYALDTPVYGVSTLLAMAEGARRELGQTQVISAIDARMGELYWATYCWRDGEWFLDGAESVVAPAQVQWPTWQNAYGVGSGWLAQHANLAVPSSLNVSLEPTVRYPHALDMLNLALPALQRGEGVKAELAEPVYLRDHVADKPTPKVKA